MAQASPVIYPFLSLYTGREFISVFGLHIRGLNQDGTKLVPAAAAGGRRQTMRSKQACC